mmetsp:Transcript_9124/g.34109  ORF Transcript_9124/g.34109 Transcript_9124/m.34109 type:complete len:163 (-) Transcript_9124:482-970(-)
MSHSMSLCPCVFSAKGEPTALRNELFAYVSNVLSLFPKKTNFPEQRIMARSNRENAYAVGLWIVARIVVSRVLSFFTTDMTSFAVNESSPEVGSSRKRTDGSVMSAIAMLSRFAWPPDRPFTIADPTTTSFASHSPKSLSNVSTASSFCANGSAIGRFSSAV